MTKRQYYIDLKLQMFILNLGRMKTGLAEKVKKQKNFCVNLFRKTEKYHFQGQICLIIKKIGKQLSLTLVTKG